MSLELVKREVRPPDPTLAELSEVVSSEHALAMQAGESMVLHAIKAGEALTSVKARLSHGEWLPWLSENFPASYKTAQIYLRLARARDLVSGAPNLRAALHLVSGEVQEFDNEVLERCRRGEITRAEAARRLGVAHGTVTYRLGRNGRSNRLRATRERAARAALRRQEQEAAVRRAGGPGAKAYALLRRALQIAQQAHDEAPNQEARDAYSTALRRGHAMEDEIAKAVRLS